MGIATLTARSCGVELILEGDGVIRALVCGSSRGIGLAVAQNLASAGILVTCLARNADMLNKFAGQTASVAEPIVADLSDYVKVADEVEAYMSVNGPFSVLVNNSGGPPAGPITAAKPSDFMRGLESHLFASSKLSSLLLPHMKSEGWGRIINVISTSVRAPITGLGVSNTVRGAMASWSKTLSSEVAPFGITVNNVLPGYMQTERLEELVTEKAGRMGLSIHEVYESMREEVPLGRIGRAEEVAALVGFLASRDSSYITGTSIPVDGGRFGGI